MKRYKRVIVLILSFVICVGILPFFPERAKAGSLLTETVWQGSLIKMGSYYRDYYDLDFDEGCLSGSVYAGDSGDKIRLRLTNKYGTKPLSITAVYVAVGYEDGSINKDTLTQLTIKGKDGYTLEPGQNIWTNFARFSFEYGEKIVYYIFSDEGFELRTMCGDSRHIDYYEDATPDMIDDLEADDETYESYGFCSVPYVDMAQTAVSERKDLFLIFGDSQSTLSYPERLLWRLADADRTNTVVLCDAVAGNCLTHDSVVNCRHGIAGIKRFKQVLNRYSAYNIKGIFIMIGSNDLLQSGTPAIGNEVTTLYGMKKAYSEMIEEGHKAGAKVYFGTMIPFKGSTLATTEGSKNRQTLNKWIKNNKDIDGVIDVAALLARPTDKDRMAARYDSGDHLHQNAAADAEIADAFKLSWISR